MLYLIYFSLSLPYVQVFHVYIKFEIPFKYPQEFFPLVVSLINVFLSVWKNDRWLIFNYSVKLLSNGILLYYILYNSIIVFYQTSRVLKEF